MRPRSTGCEGTMLLLAFLIAVGIGIYLLVTLLRPEAF
ncbi:potassium-transporting ATPase subunit F [Devosia enhydra]|nr:potassium-transporting ATPase subunit F [Devosia enhydra]